MDFIPAFKTFLTRTRLIGTWIKCINWLSTVQWRRTQAVLNGGRYYSLCEADHDLMRRLLKSDYFVILVRRRCELSTYLVAIGTWLVTRQWPHWTHGLMNVEGDIQNNVDFRLVEATAIGTHYNTFMSVFDCDSVVLLKPRGIELALWTSVLDRLRHSLGTPYDNLYDLTNDKQLSCVGLIYLALLQFVGYEVMFPNLLRLIRENGNNLTPQMLYECGDFDIVYEVRR